MIGSSNMDMRSFALNYEVVMMLVGGDVVAPDARRRGHLPRPVAGAHRSTSGARRSGDRAYVDNVMRLTAALQ